MVHRLTSTVLSLLLLFVLTSPASANNAVQSLTYVAVGDSYAAGVTPELGLDLSYTDYIALDFKKRGQLVNYTKEFTRSGFDSVEITNQLKTDEGLRNAIADADLITLSAGGNDFLSLLQYDLTTGEVWFDTSAAVKVFFGFKQRLQAVYDEINMINPDVKIYTVGYAFPLPHLTKEQKDQLLTPFNFLNQTIKDTAKENGAIFVELDAVFGKGAVQYFPNPVDIHPNKEGYRLIANQFIKQYHPVPAFKDVPLAHWAKVHIDPLTQRNFMSGYTDGTFKPESHLTKAEAAEAVYRALYLDEEIFDAPNPGFSDVPVTHPNYKAIATLTEKGIFIKAGKFNPDSSLTRARMAKVFTLSFEVQTSTPMVFKDMTGGNAWAEEFVSSLSSNGYVKGYPDGTFKPNMPMTKAQTAKILDLLVKDRGY